MNQTAFIETVKPSTALVIAKTAHENVKCEIAKIRLANMKTKTAIENNIGAMLQECLLLCERGKADPLQPIFSWADFQPVADAITDLAQTMKG